MSHGTLGVTAVTYELDIRPADKIQFRKHFDIFNGETYKANIVIGNHLQQDKISNLIVADQNMTGCFLDVLEIDFFDCKLTSREKEINVLNKFSIQAVFDRDMGSYACEIKLLTSLEDLTNVVKHKDLNLELQVIICHINKFFLESKLIKIPISGSLIIRRVRCYPAPSYPSSWYYASEN